MARSLLLYIDINHVWLPHEILWHINLNDTQNVRLLGWCRYINLVSDPNGTSSLKIYKEQLQLAKAKCAGNVTNLPKFVEKITLC